MPDELNYTSHLMTYEEARGKLRDPDKVVLEYAWRVYVSTVNEDIRLEEEHIRQLELEEEKRARERWSFVRKASGGHFHPTSHHNRFKYRTRTQKNIETLPVHSDTLSMHSDSINVVCIALPLFSRSHPMYLYSPSLL